MLIIHLTELINDLNFAAQNYSLTHEIEVTYTLLFLVFPSVTLKNIIERNFPEEYAERKLENDNLTNMGPDLLPLFVLDVVLPCQKFHLNIFEARYRLMVIFFRPSSVKHFLCQIRTQMIEIDLNTFCCYMYFLK